MPQLMPITWVMSIMMIMYIVLVVFFLFYFKLIYKLNIVKYNNIVNMFWLW